ncbi:hypothetical protein [Paenibacillus odorifer]|nr:hypothetical protein [Paenibacillus odorifer]
MMSDVRERVLESAVDAVCQTIDNRFDVIKTTQDLYDKYKEE